VSAPSSLAAHLKEQLHDRLRRSGKQREPVHERADRVECGEKQQKSVTARRDQGSAHSEGKEELANKAESEALKKKDAVEKKQFKKGQDDLEKALGF
jgi:hypothetical protein